MKENHLVTKASGEKQYFSEDKLRASLQRSGAGKQAVEAVIGELHDQLYDGISTRKIYRMAFRFLRRRQRVHAARYSLKDAIMQLGPTGYPFEYFVGKLFEATGYTVEVGAFVRGLCVQHEVDVVARNETQIVMAECKYHNDRGKVCNVHVPLYVNSRFQDIFNRWQQQDENKGKTFEGWVVTNTRFTSDAEDYGLCAGLKMIGWDFPAQAGLKERVEKTGLFPITVITGLTKKVKEQLFKENIVLCRDLIANEKMVKKIIENSKKAAEVLQEASDLCGADV